MVLDRERGRQLIKIRVRIVGVPCDHAMFRPVHNRRFMNAEANSSFGCHQHTAVAKPIIARAERVSMDEVGNAQRGEAGMAAPRSSRSAGTKLLLVEDVCDLGIDVVIEELVDELDDHGGCPYLLRGGLGIQRCQRFGLAALEAHVDTGDAFRRQFDQRGVLDDVGE